LRSNKLVAVDPNATESSSAERVRYWWLILVGVVGAGLLTAGVVLGISPLGKQLLPTVLMDVGVGVLLFVLLFGVERGAVRKVVRAEAERAFRSLSQPLTDPKDLVDMQEADDAILRETELLGVPPFDAAIEWIRCASEGDSYSLLYDRSTYEYRLCRAQDWVWNNREHPNVASEHDFNWLAQRLAEPDEACDLLTPFLEIESRTFRDTYGSVNADTLGVPSRRRVVAPGYERVILAPMADHPDGILVLTPMLLGDSWQLLMEWTGDKWLLASDRSVAPPRPGLPPAWWSDHSVPPDALHRATPQTSNEAADGEPDMRDSRPVGSR
jgi:hypothetical protein